VVLASNGDTRSEVRSGIFSHILAEDFTFTVHNTAEIFNSVFSLLGKTILEYCSRLFTMAVPDLFFFQSGQIFKLTFVLLI